jgi:23S rRNA (cytidine1920-2'-O)/16S rRNA (cytidine1409-2'-O)-methyltransferase
VLLVERGLAESRERAQALILAGRVRVDGRPADKAGAAVPTGAMVELVAPLPFVSRGGVKLRAALEAFGVRPAGRVAIDVGASTGGFTDCLLQAGAAHVYAVDVGFGQLDLRLRNDPRVALLERTNIRHLRREALTPAPNLATIDVSFISLSAVLPVVVGLLDSPREVIALVKPQFEVGKGQVGKGGVVRDPAKHRAVLLRLGAVARAAGFEPRALIPSPLLGPKGNREFLVHLVQSSKLKVQSPERVAPEGAEWAARVEECLAVPARAARAGKKGADA